MIKEEISKGEEIDIIVSILPRKNSEQYNAIKQFLLIEVGLPS